MKKLGLLLVISALALIFATAFAQDINDTLGTINIATKNIGTIIFILIYAMAGGMIIFGLIILTQKDEGHAQGPTNNKRFGAKLVIIGIAAFSLNGLIQVIGQSLTGDTTNTKSTDSVFSGYANQP